MNEDALTEGEQTRGERLHPLYLLTGLKEVAKNAWSILVGGAFFAFQGKLGIALLIMGAIVAFTVIRLLVKWLTFEYRLDADELHIDQGLISRSSRAIPFDRVTDVDIEQGPVQRLLGLARVKLETGAASGSKDEEGVLDTISLDRAEAIREYIRARRRGQVAVPSEADSPALEDGPPVFAMDLRRVLTAGVFNFSLAFLAAIVGLTQTFGDVIGFDPFSRRFWLDLLATTGPLYDYVIAHQIIAVIGGTLVTILIGAAAGVITTLLSDYGFRLDRTESGFRRRRGLITLTDVSIPQRRVQASLLVTGPIRRAFGWFTLKLQSLAMDDKQGNHVVAPLAQEDEAAAIQHSLGRPLAPDDAAWRPLPFAHFTSSAAPLVLPTIAIPIAAAFFSPWVLIALVGVAVGVASQWLECRRARYALDGDYLFIDQGWWKQRRSIIPVTKIQSLDITENFWTRLFGFTRIRLGIAGGTLLGGFGIDALSRVDAEALRAQLMRA